jgi:hypothetical protein
MDKTTGVSHWRSFSKDDVTAPYGKGDDEAAPATRDLSARHCADGKAKPEAGRIHSPTK